MPSLSLSLSPLARACEKSRLYSARSEQASNYRIYLYVLTSAFPRRRIGSLSSPHPFPPLPITVTPLPTVPVPRRPSPLRPPHP
jgi:hypothetical protein